jgi:DNA-binding response OmpR family regulator
MRILLVDDDREVAEYVRRDLEEESFSVVVVHDGPAALRVAECSAFDIIVLDVMMPFMDGLQVTRSLRRQHILAPILLLTGRDAPEEIVRGLEAGADDYLTKPFSFDVLLARIRARTRRLDQTTSQLRFADLRLNVEEHKAWRGKREMILTRTEFAILECLLRAAGRVVTRDRLIDTVWNDR